MAVNSLILDEYIDKKVEIILKNNQGILTGKLIKKNKNFFLENKKISISKILAIKEEV